MVHDDVFNENFANLVIEFVTFNPTNKYFLLTTIQFKQCLAGLIDPVLKTKALRKNLYSTKTD